MYPVFAILSELPTSDDCSLQYDVPALKAFVLNHIRNELGNCDIVEESFSRFASRSVGHIAKVNFVLTERRRYDEIKSLYINQLASVWMEDSTTEATQASVEKKIDSFVEEGFEHATEMLSTLWEIVNKDGDIKAPENTSSAVRRLQLCLHPRLAQKCLFHISRPRRPRVPHTGTL